MAARLCAHVGIKQQEMQIHNTALLWNCKTIRQVSPLFEMYFSPHLPMLDRVIVEVRLAVRPSDTL